MSLEVGTVKGIPIRLHFTLLLVSLLVVWALATMLMPEIYPGLSSTLYWTMGAAGAIILIISVLLHELAHSIVALRYGLKVSEIVLYIFGGVSVIKEQEEASKDFHKEFRIAVVGPIASFVIAAIFAISFFLLTLISSESTITTINTADITSSNHTLTIIAAGLLQYGALVNIILGGFNLIPIFPSDGGRILRSVLLRLKKNDYDKSTKITVRIGIMTSYVFMGFGFFNLISGSPISGIWILIIGWFLISRARSYLAQFERRRSLSGVEVGTQNMKI
jgi:Zn-dependent protease